MGKTGKIKMKPGLRLIFEIKAMPSSCVQSIEMGHRPGPEWSDKHWKNREKCCLWFKDTDLFSQGEPWSPSEHLLILTSHTISNNITFST